MTRTRVIVFGYDRLVLASLGFLAASDAEVAAVVFPSRPRDERIDEVRREIAAMGHVVLEQPRRSLVDEFKSRLAELSPDLFLIWSYPMILPAELIAVPPLGSVNMHLGLLPQYRGVNGVRWALLNGEEQTGVTLHFMDSGIDTGPMIARLACPIESDDDIVSLMRKSRIAGLTLLEHAWPAIASGSAQAIPQDARLAGYFSAAMSPDLEIDWGQPASSIHNLIRAAVPPYGGARTRFRGEEIIILRSSPIATASPAGPGEIVSAGGDGPATATGEGLLLIREARIGGMTYSGDRLAEFGIVPGGRFGN